MDATTAFVICFIVMFLFFGFLIWAISLEGSEIMFFKKKKIYKVEYKDTWGITVAQQLKPLMKPLLGQRLESNIGQEALIGQPYVLVLLN